jgi:hypothetical protein
MIPVVLLAINTGVLSSFFMALLCLTVTYPSFQYMIISSGESQDCSVLNSGFEERSFRVFFSSCLLDDIHGVGHDDASQLHRPDISYLHHHYRLHAGGSHCVVLVSKHFRNVHHSFQGIVRPRLWCL